MYNQHFKTKEFALLSAYSLSGINLPPGTPPKYINIQYAIVIIHSSVFGNIAITNIHLILNTLNLYLNIVLDWSTRDGRFQQ